MDYSLPGSPIHGTLQARILEWLPFPSPGALPDPGIEPGSSALAGEFFTRDTKLKLQNFGHLMRRTNLLEKTLMLGEVGGWRRRG